MLELIGTRPLILPPWLPLKGFFLPAVKVIMTSSTVENSSRMISIVIPMRPFLFMGWRL